MAKKWKPSLKQLSEYDKLLARQNEVRKRLLRRRRIIEEEGVGRTLPDLILPHKVKRYRNIIRYRFDSYAEFIEQRRALKDLVGTKDDALKHFYKRAYKDNILKIIKGWITDNINFNYKPERNGRYSKDQIDLANKVAEDGGKYLKLYNKLIGLSIDEFMIMYDTGMIPPLKFIYTEMTGEAEFSIVDEFIDTFSDKRRQVLKQSNIFVRKLTQRNEKTVTRYNKRATKYKV